ncbi:MAG: RNA polymerase sigma-70 factor [Bacteroidales bacterium]|jgi:RNA polymerase sigma-70 factor (ECF subfamily)|nr:RNA polymerase sigma-70 factor [Bacteroidales bacterium]
MNVKTCSDKELVVLLSGGSGGAFEELYARYKTRLLYFCNRFMKNKSESEDILQDIFIQIWETRDSLNPDLSFAAYLHTLARNRILNLFRQRDIHERFARATRMNCPEEDHQTETEIIDRDYAELMKKALETLSPRQKEIFLLSRRQELTYKEISKMLNISVFTVQEYASIALLKIKKYLTQYGDIYFKLVLTAALLMT